MLLDVFKTQLRFASNRPKLVATSVRTTVPQASTIINHSPYKANERKRLPLRCGALTQKVGMMPYFDLENGKRIAVTVLEMNNVEVMMHRTMKQNGYYACQVGYGSKNPKNVSRQMLGHFASKIVNPKQKVTEFRVKSADCLLPIRTLIKPSHFKPGQFVDIKSISKGKGFAGVMKRHGFKGLKASHGVSLAHRKGGSYGQNQTPGRVLPGKKMPGHMGVQNVTIRNVQVIKVDDINGIILVKGSVAGPKRAFVKIQDAIKKPYSFAQE